MPPDHTALEKVIVDALRESARPVINELVNGKVNGLRKEFQDYIRRDDERWEKMLEWQKTAQPVVELNEEGKVVLRFIKWIGAIVVGVAGFLYAVQEIFKTKIF